MGEVSPKVPDQPAERVAMDTEESSGVSLPAAGPDESVKDAFQPARETPTHLGTNDVFVNDRIRKSNVITVRSLAFSVGGLVVQRKQLRFSALLEPGECSPIQRGNNEGPPILHRSAAQPEAGEFGRQFGLKFIRMTTAASGGDFPQQGHSLPEIGMLVVGAAETRGGNRNGRPTDSPRAPKVRYGAADGPYARVDAFCGQPSVDGNRCVTGLFLKQHSCSFALSFA
jgi:hypothetical protein